MEPRQIVNPPKHVENGCHTTKFRKHKTKITSSIDFMKKYKNTGFKKTLKILDPF